MIRACAPLAALVATVSPALADPGAVDWLRGNLNIPTHLHDGGVWEETGGAVLAVDPLTLFGADAGPIAVPRQPARIVGIRETNGTDPRTAFLVLVWSDAPVVCGEDLATIGVDTGLAAFLAPRDVAALNAYGAAYGGDLYAGPFAADIDKRYPGPYLAQLPDGTAFPLSGSGWGDGGYPVASLQSADGNMVALYAQFITDGADWLLPAPCPPDPAS